MCIRDRTAGILENLEVVNDDVDAETASFVKGKSYVGGITGTLIADSDSVVSAVTWKELSNAAKVTGLSHVGGVVGSFGQRRIGQLPSHWKTVRIQELYMQS